jgi:hypothetical protein
VKEKSSNSSMSEVDASAKAIFLGALEQKTRQEVVRLLETACGGNEALRTRVEELLRAYRDAGNFLGGPSSDDK